jgi:hypothetical protein
MGGKEFAGDALFGHLPRDVLDAVFADVHVQALSVVGPGTAGAVEAAVLVVHPKHGPRAVNQFPLPQED